jgi:hypothetical protein
MAKIAVRLTHPHNTFKTDDGVRFAPYEVTFVEDSQRIQDALKIRVLERVREAEKSEPIAEAKEKPAKDVKAKE